MATLLYGIGIGIFSVFIVIGLFKLYQMWEVKQLMRKYVKAELEKETTQQDEIQKTIQQLEDLANDED